MKALLIISAYKTDKIGLEKDLLKKGMPFLRYSFMEKPTTAFQNKSQLVFNEFKAIIKLMLHIHLMRCSKIYCTGCQIATMFIFRIFYSWLSLKKTVYPHLYIHNFYLHGLSKNKYVKMLLRFVLNNEYLTLICQSPNEIGYYRELSKKVNLFFVPYSSDFMPESMPLFKDEIKVLGDYIFSGGYTNRDYQLIYKLARRHPEQHFVIVASRLNTNIANPPANVALYQELSRELFENLLSHSVAVIIALLHDVGSSGQMLCISAMRNKKPIIYADVSAISYYFSSGCGYPYQLGNIDSLDAAYNTLIRDKEKAVALGRHAYTQSLLYTQASCNEQLLKIIFDEAKIKGLI